jgi:hypothetical protein
MSIGSRLLLLLALAAPAHADGISVGGAIPVGQVPATGTNDNACATCVGAIVQSTLASGSAVTVTSGTPINVTSVALTGGDWDCRGTIARNVGATTSFTKLNGSLGTTTGALAAEGTEASTYTSTAANVVATSIDTKIGPTRFSLSGGSTVFLVVGDTFTVSTDAAYGQLTCRRAR